jgi:predicted small lipoprotein YifL
MMLSHNLSAARRPALVCLAALLLAGGLAACGRRGPLEAPPNASARPAGGSTGTRATTTSGPTGPAKLATQPQAGTTDTPEDEVQADPADSVLPTPTPAPPGTRRRGRAFDVPKEPFILDPIL